jgi:hypothetical protein
MDVAYISSIAMGIGLSACCGFRIFIPLLITSLATYFHWLPVSPSLTWMGTLPALLCLGTAAVVEIGAYYIPFVDNLLDTISTPLSVLAGTVLAYSFLPDTELSPLLRWGLGLLAGGSTAGVIQSATGILRLFSTKATVGTINPLVSTGENLAAIGGSILSILLPILALVLLLVGMGWLMVRWLIPRKSL